MTTAHSLHLLILGKIDQKFTLLRQNMPQNTSWPSAVWRHHFSPTNHLLIETHGLPCLWIQLPDSFHQPHQSCLDSLRYSLVSSLILHSTRLLHSNTVIGTLAVDGWAVTFGTVRRGLSGLGPRPVPSLLYQLYIIIADLV